LWKEKYSTPQTFKTSDELNVARDEAAKVFPVQAISTYQDAQGNYVLSIKQPVSKIGDNPIADNAMNNK